MKKYKASARKNGNIYILIVSSDYEEVHVLHISPFSVRKIIENYGYINTKIKFKIHQETKQGNQKVKRIAPKE